MLYLVTHSVQQYKPGELSQFLGYIYFQQKQHIFHKYLSNEITLNFCHKTACNIWLGLFTRLAYSASASLSGTTTPTPIIYTY
jgi:hypothetical protein